MDPSVASPPVAVDGLDLDVVTAELTAVEAALGRLDEGGYGACVACGSALPDELLVADPTRIACPVHTPAPG